MGTGICMYVCVQALDANVKNNSYQTPLTLWFSACSRHIKNSRRDRKVLRHMLNETSLNIWSLDLAFPLSSLNKRGVWSYDPQSRMTP